MNAPPNPASDPTDVRWAALCEAETLGEPLTPHEHGFLRTYLPVDPALRAEHALRVAMASWGEGPAPSLASGEDDEAVLAAALNGHLHETARAGRTRAGRTGWLAVAGLATAAAVVLAVMLSTGDDPARSSEVAQVDAPAQPTAVPEPAPAAGALRGLSGTWIDEAGTPLGGVATPGVVLTASSAACMGDGVGGRLCVEPGARVRAVAAEAPTLEWLEGRGELTTPPARAAASAMVLEVRVAGMHVTGVGARMAVETTTDGYWSLSVREGEVSLQTPEGTRALGPGDRWAPAGEASAARIEGPSRTTTPDAASLLRQARAARAEGSMADAAALYRRLLRAHPRAASSGPAWVALGQVELARGRAKAALEAFDRYLARGGPLAEEAAYGRIEALHALGRTADEQAASARFLTKYPGSSYAAKLRRRP